MTPSARTMHELRERGFVCDKSEYWNPYSKTRHDLFNFLDIVALDGGKITGVQATSRSNHSARCKKAKALDTVRLWLSGGGIFEVWSWGKSRKTKKWEPRISKAFLLEDEVTFCDT